ncbi:efflux RND transporter periplasmic adaptor subunit [Aeromonas sp. FDAARGOS 1409]|uniref:efflux RND transporter periplasmic adaptor subunit n=1 Tax=Aeromonas TaxID=642 RepID=UPI001C24A858|nr:efflux RND transporter periplasmic adaptor subunit [Aeromonas sp. FDAARGOS 1409]QXC30146.1 efflux RND transporter periplasmic adaptor subunit [Aeromonas sp. FDAARGOS 1409]
MKRGWLWWTAGAGVAVAVLAWWLRPVATPVPLVSVDRGEVRVTVVNTRAGTIKSCQRAGLSLPAGGVVERIAVKAGDRVAQGDLLLTLWSEDIRADLARARAQQALGKTQREERCSEAAYYEREASRLATLLAKNLTSRTLAEQAQNLADTRRYICRASRQQERVDEAQVAQVEARLAERRLLAPFAGVVAEVNSKLGEYMTPSPPGVAMPPVIDLIDDRCLYVSAPIDEVDAARLRVGQRARVLLDAMPGRDLAATVTRIAPYVKELEKQARTVEVEAALTAPPGDVPLLIGYSADLEVEVTRATDVLRVAASSRADDGSVLRLEGDRLVRVRPRWGVENWNWVEVTEGLAAGDRLAAQPGQIAGEGPFTAATETVDE